MHKRIDLLAYKRTPIVFLGFLVSGPALEQVMKQALMYFRIHNLGFLEYRTIDSAIIVVLPGCRRTDLALVYSTHPNPQRYGRLLEFREETLTNKTQQY